MDALNEICVALSVLLTSSSDSTSLAKSSNFAVSAPSEEVASEVLVAAESFRRELALEWLNKELPEGIGFCVIVVQLSEREQGGSTSEMKSKRGSCYLIRLKTSRAKVTGAPLAHEILHALTATQFPQGLPPWAAEGTACLAEDVDGLCCRRALVWFSKTGTWPRLKELLEAENIPETEHDRYWAAALLTQYLLARGDRQTLFRFAIAGKSDGWIAALRRHYAIETADDLQKEWEKWARNKLKTETKPLIRE